MFRFEHCWPAFAKDTDGVVLVHNPSQPLLQEKELERWSVAIRLLTHHTNLSLPTLFLNLIRYSYFVNQQELQADQCMILTHHKQTSTDHQEEHKQLSCKATHDLLS